MKFWAVFRFELAYQARRFSTWVYVPVLIFFAFVQFPGNIPAARNSEYFLGAPFVIAEGMAMACIAWLVVAAFISGDAAARDVSSGMDPLTYTSPVSKAEYLGGRFLAAFVINVVILLAVPVGAFLGVHTPEGEAAIRGPVIPMAYITMYLFFVVPFAFVCGAVQFTVAALSRRAVSSYVASIVLLGLAQANALLRISRDTRQLTDPLGLLAMMREDLTVGWTKFEMNTRLIAIESGSLTNRLLWSGIALGILAFAHHRFRFSHPVETSWWSRIARRRKTRDLTPADPEIVGSTSVSVPRVRLSFGFATRVKQVLAIAWPSFLMIAKSRSGIIFGAAITLLAFPLTLDGFNAVPLYSRTEHVLASLIRPQPGPLPWLLIPLLIVFWAGQLIWREREARMNEIIDAAPVPEWVVLAGKFVGLSLLPVAIMAAQMAAGIMVQMIQGSSDIEFGLYAKVLFGLQLADYVQLSLFALAAHVVVNHKQVGQFVILVGLLSMMLVYSSGLGYDFLVPVFDPSWTYTDMFGFSPSLVPWLWFKVYWIAWVVLLAVAARLLWVRGMDGGFRERLRIAGGRFTGPTVTTAAVIGLVVLTTGGFIFYNTNGLTERLSDAERIEQRAEFERRYGQYNAAAQPRLTGTELQAEIFPERREVRMRGTYSLVNSSTLPIDSVHLTTVPGVVTAGVEFDRPATTGLVDDELGYHIYLLGQPLMAGDSLELSFEVNVALRGFTSRGMDTHISANSTFFTNQEWLPAVGYQQNREIANAFQRAAHGLSPRPEVPSLDDVAARQPSARAERIALDVVVSTSEDQVAVAPGILRRTWAEGGRRFYHYSTDEPIGNEYAFYSSDYAVHETQWNEVAIEIFHHPRHTENLERIVQSVRASLAYYTEHFGPVQRNYVRLVERPGHEFGLHEESGMITYGEGFTLLNPGADSRGFDLVFATIAHEVGHGWGVRSARVEGSAFLSESFAWYAALGVVGETHGLEHLRRLLSWMRQPFPIQPVRASAPLLRSNSSYLNYRKGPFALYAMREYVGEEEVNAAFRRLRDEHGSIDAPRATMRDLYRQLEAVTPDSLQYLLHDLFEANTIWEFGTDRVTAGETPDGTWQVTLDVRAHKVVVDTAGVETPVAMDDWVEIGVFAPAVNGSGLGEPIYLHKHRIRSAEQTITLTVPREPGRAGIDPYHLIDWAVDDNTMTVGARK